MKDGSSSRQTQSGRDLLDVLNSRANSGTRRLVTRPVSSSARGVASDDGSNGPPMPYSFSYDVAGGETQTYISRGQGGIMCALDITVTILRQEESDGETVTGTYSYVDPTGALIIVTYRQVNLCS